MACCRSGPDLHPMYFFAQWIWGPAETVSQGSLEYVTSFYCMDKDLGKGSGKGIGQGSPAQPEPKPELPLEPEADEEVVVAAVDVGKRDCLDEAMPERVGACVGSMQSTDTASISADSFPGTLMPCM